MTIYYTYRLVHIETGQFYIGSKLVHNVQNAYESIGISYKSSGAKVHEIGFENFYYGIIRDDYRTYEECLNHERAMIRENIKNPLCLNLRWTTRVAKRRKKRKQNDRKHLIALEREKTLLENMSSLGNEKYQKEYLIRKSLKAVGLTKMR